MRTPALIRGEADKVRYMSTGDPGREMPLIKGDHALILAMSGPAADHAESEVGVCRSDISQRRNSVISSKRHVNLRRLLCFPSLTS